MKNLSSYYLHLDGRYVYAVELEGDEVEGFIPTSSSWPRVGVVERTEPVHILVGTKKTRGEIVGYQLRQPEFASPAMPEFVDEDVYDQMDDPVQEFYRPKRAPDVVERVTLELPDREWPGFTSAPPPQEHPGRWEPAAAIAALFGFAAPYSHMIPGRLVGFHAAAAELVAQHPHYNPVTIFQNEKLPRVDKDKIEARFIIPHEDGLTEQVKDRRRRYNRQATILVTRVIQVGPNEIHGHHLGEALVEWHHRLDQIQAELPGVGLVCEHCRGVGFTS